VGAYFVLRTVSPKWRPIVLFNCLPPQENASGQGSQTISNTQDMDRFMQTQVRMMTSDSVMRRVAEDAQLQSRANKWAGRFLVIDGATGQERPDYDAIAKELSEAVGARVIPQTNLIELAVTDRSASDATEILSLVRQKYLGVLKDQTLSQSDDRIAALRKQLDRIDEEVKGWSKKRESLVQNKNLDSLNDNYNATKMWLSDTNQELLKVEQSLQAAGKKKMQMEAVQAGAWPPDILAEVEKDSQVVDVQSAISRMETERQMLINKGVAPEHREVRFIDSRLEGAKQNLERVRAERITKKFYGELDELTKVIEQFQAQADSLRSQAKTATDRLTDLTTAQGQLNDYDAQIRGLLDSKAKANADLQNQISLQQMGSFNRVVELQRERTPNEMAFPRLKLMIPAGIILCVGLVGGVVLLREIVDQRVKGPSDITIIPRTKLLGWVPDAAEDPAGQGATETAFRDRTRGIVAESFRQIRGSLGKRLAQADHKTILVVAGMPGSGATSTVSNLAFAFAAADKRVLVIDANFRRPTLHRVMGVQEGAGLSDVLGRAAELTDAIQATSTPNLDLLSAGSKEHRVYERLATEAMGEVLTKVRMMYDVVLIDCAPAIVAGDGIALAHRCDASVLVVRALAEKRGMIARLKNELSDSRSEFMGVIVNAVRSSSGGYMKGNIRAAHEYQQA
jgi:polysaccharide biosynthesis transport protein